MNWAAITYTVLLLMTLLAGLALHGKKRADHNAVHSIGSFIVTVFLLWQAGFFE